MNPPIGVNTIERIKVSQNPSRLELPTSATISTSSAGTKYMKKGSRTTGIPT